MQCVALTLNMCWASTGLFGGSSHSCVAVCAAVCVAVCIAVCVAVCVAVCDAVYVAVYVTVRYIEYVRNQLDSLAAAPTPML